MNSCLNETCQWGNRQQDDASQYETRQLKDGELANASSGNNLTDQRNNGTDKAMIAQEKYEQRQEAEEARGSNETTKKHKGWFGNRKKKDQIPKEQTLWWQMGQSAKVRDASNKQQKQPPLVNTPAIDSTHSYDLTSSGTFFLNDTRQRKAVFHQFGFNAKSVLSVEETDTMPFPDSDDHVVIKVQASTVSLQDCLNRRGFCFDVLSPVCLPSTPGCDVVGSIALCGSAVTSDYGVGDRVAALVRTGGNARYISVPQASLVKVPGSLSSIEIACMISIYATAYQALKLMSDKTTMFSLKGKKVLVVGGMDGVGQALIQLCRKGRADVHATAPDRRHDYVRNVLGAIPLPENASAWSVIAAGEFDMVFDGVCEDSLRSSQQSLKPNGKVVCFGYSSMLRENEMGLFGAPLSAHLKKIQTASFYGTVDIWESFHRDPELYKRNLHSLFQLLKWHKIKPHVAKRVALSQVAGAQAKLETGEVRGTVVCLPWRRVNGKDIVKTDMGEPDSSPSW